MCYTFAVAENNEHILEILKNHYYLLEDGDFEMATDFVVNYTRNKVEFDRELKLPISIYQQLGNISTLPPKFVQAISERFTQKRATWKQLTKS